MSTVPDTATLLAGAARRVNSMYAKDLRALPDAAYAVSHGGVARTPQDFTAEVAGFNYMVAGALNGTMTAPPTPEERAAYTQKVSTKDAGVAEVLGSAEALAKAIEGAGSKLGEMYPAPWGEEMPFAALANLAVNHTMYHDGQLTFLQCLHGDAEMHWFDE